MGLALPALAGELLAERTARDAAALLTVRHAGIALALLLIAPIAASRLDATVQDARLQGVAIVLDAPLAPQDKLGLAPDLLASVEDSEPRNALRRAIAGNRDRFSGEDLEAYTALGRRADDVLVSAVGRSFEPAFLIAGALALLGALALALWQASPLRLGLLAPILAAALLAPAAYGLASALTGPEEVAIADPCEERDSPDSGGLSGLIQDQVLSQLDRVACENGSSREELVLALGDDAEAQAYERRYGVDPGSLDGLLQVLG